MDRGWLFHLGDVPFPVIKGQGPSYENAKAGQAWGAAAPDGDDSDWRQLDLPHDWAVEGPFDPDANLSQGYRPRGVGWYRRYFELDESDQGKHLELQFDGVATHCVVWVNGILAHRNWCGYNSFHIDVTPFAKYGNDVNTIAVRVDANPMEGWWYEGAGIYRHTWLIKRSPVHVMTDGVFANPIRGADGFWTVPVEVTLGNSGSTKAKTRVEATLIVDDDPLDDGFGWSIGAEFFDVTAVEEVRAVMFVGDYAGTDLTLGGSFFVDNLMVEVFASAAAMMATPNPNTAPVEMAGLPGDYNENNVVDAADYTVWRNNLGSPNALPNDSSPGVGPDDYDRWKMNFGNTLPGSGSVTGGTVPEPATLMLLVIGLAWTGRGRRSR